MPGEYETFEAWQAYIDNYGQSLKQQARRQRMPKRWTALYYLPCTVPRGWNMILFFIDANEGVVPHKKAVMAEDLEEERRMFYVAMTRAKKPSAYLFYKERYKKPGGNVLFCRRISCGQRCI